MPTDVLHLTGRFFSEVFSISPNGNLMVGTLGASPNPNNILGGSFHGFSAVRNSGPGPWATLFNERRYPGAATSAVGTNDYGDIVGFYRDDLQNTHGFVWPLSYANPLRFDIKGAVDTPVVSGMISLIMRH